MNYEIILVMLLHQKLIPKTNKKTHSQKAYTRPHFESIYQVLSKQRDIDLYHPIMKPNYLSVIIFSQIL